MPSFRLLHVTKRVLICVGILVGGFAPISLLSQGVPIGSAATFTADGPFAEFDKTVLKAADDLLDDRGDKDTSLPVQDRRRDAEAIESLSDSNLQFNQRSARVPVAAAARLKLLRPLIDPILRSRGIPTELAVMTLVESGGSPTALSSKGALGLWQLMPATARRYGLQVDAHVDDRLDIRKSTWAASLYLSDLHLQFGSWALALAAYNTGAHHVQRAITRSGSMDFTVLSSTGMLPVETRAYVPRIVSVLQSLGTSLALGEVPITANPATVFASSSR